MPTTAIVRRLRSWSLNRLRPKVVLAGVFLLYKCLSEHDSGLLGSSLKTHYVKFLPTFILLGKAERPAERFSISHGKA